MQIFHWLNNKLEVEHVGLVKACLAVLYFVSQGQSPGLQALSTKTLTANNS